MRVEQAIFESCCSRYDCGLNLVVRIDADASQWQTAGKREEVDPLSLRYEKSSLDLQQIVVRNSFVQNMIDPSLYLIFLTTRFTLYGPIATDKPVW